MVSTRGKVCSFCGSWSVAKSTHCHACGEPFPVKAPIREDISKLLETKSADIKIVQGTVERTRNVKITKITAGIHKKTGTDGLSPRHYTLRIAYYGEKGGESPFPKELCSQYLCFNHTGYAREKALDWWRTFIEEKSPIDVDDALRLIKEAKNYLPTVADVISKARPDSSYRDISIFPCNREGISIANNLLDKASPITKTAPPDFLAEEHLNKIKNSWQHREVLKVFPGTTIEAARKLTKE